jgi:two-component system, OmpR family, phosphate regulon sensor histidine kinase PhoR
MARLIAFRRWWVSFPYVLAVAALIFIAWSASVGFAYPHDGILDYSSDGRINQLDPIGENVNNLKVGDVIVEIDGKPFNLDSPPYLGKHIGEQVEFSVRRSGIILPLTIQLSRQPLDLVLVPVLVAAIFWGIGIIVLSFRPGDYASSLFSLFSITTALLLSSGLVSGIGPRFTSSLFNFLIWITGPMMVQFHMHFPQTITAQWRRLILGAQYILVLFGGLPFIIWGKLAVVSNPWLAVIQPAGRLFLTMNLLMVVGLLVYSYRHVQSPGARSKIRIVVLGVAMSLLPFIALILLPEALLGQIIIPYTFGFLFIGILPLTYGYAIIRQRLIEIDRHVNRGALYILVFSLLAGVYFVLYAIVHAVMPPGIISEPLLNTLLVLILASIYSPLSLRMKRFVDTAFYGGWYDYRSAISQITHGLEQIKVLSVLASTVSERLVKTLQLEFVSVFLKDLEGDFSVVEIAPPQVSRGSDHLNPKVFLPKNSLRFLVDVGIIERTSVRTVLSEITVSREEGRLLNNESITLFVPVTGHKEVLGVIALGQKLGGDVFSSEDKDILRVVARQLAPLIENIHLLTQLRAYASQLEQRVEERTEELHAAKVRVEAVLASVGDGVVVTDLNGSIITVNHAFETQSGFQAGELLGKQIYSLVNSQGDEIKTERLRSVLLRSEGWSGELTAQRKGGQEYDIQLTMAPVRNEAGEIMGYVGSQRDITQYKELERLKDNFILEVSHELRTPVTNMGLFVDLLEHGRPERRIEYQVILKNEIAQLSHMIEEVLALSRLEVGKHNKSTFSNLNLNLLAEQVVSAHCPAAEDNGLELRFEPQRDLPVIRGDPNQLSRVITNLVSNAIRYTPQGSISVRTFHHEGWVCLEVKDTGMGIDEEDFPHLFDRFFRGKKVSQSKIMGSGLGLAIVQEIVDIHHGRIELQSENDRGSTFQVWLPR